jgi:hypothetical protein
MMDHPFRLCICCSVVGAVAAVVGIYGVLMYGPDSLVSI